MLKNIIAAGALILAPLATVAQAQAQNPATLISTESENPFDETLGKLQSAIDARGFTTFAVIDHAKGAASIGETLRPTTLIVFGNPKGGTPLMQAEQTIGLELPLKILVAEDRDGAVRLYYADTAKLFAEYEVAGQDKRLAAISGALSAIAGEAAAQ